MKKAKFGIVFGGYKQINRKKDMWKLTKRSIKNNDVSIHNHPNTNIPQTLCDNSSQRFSSKSPQETKTHINFDFVFGGYKQSNSDKQKENPKQRVLRILTKK